MVVDLCSLLSGPVQVERAALSVHSLESCNSLLGSERGVAGIRRKPDEVVT